jgi:Bacterial membrane protein YfhO
VSQASEAPAVSNGETEPSGTAAGLFERRPWGRGDLLALLVWTAAVALFFWDSVSLRRALFYFDITEINYPYRAFFADELRSGRFSRWCPGLYCGLPLYSESQAGYLHPFKYLLYPWLATWQAFNLDTVLSIWLTGVGTFCWLRRHVGAAGALTGAAIFGASGYVWGHLIHTSMINALASVPFVIWGLESSWETRRWRGAVLGALALACQVFAGHLQDSLLTIGLVCLYGIYRASTERGFRTRLHALAVAATLVVLGVLISGVQWVPSKELLDRSPRAGGLSWYELTYGSWSPELLPTLIVREAYGTRARDTGWMNGFYPYHEMNTYMGLIAIVLAVVGARGPARRDRWSSFWVLLIGLGWVLMLGKFTFLFDYANRLPVLGSSREPVRFHVWVSLGVAALAATGVERLGRPGFVSLRHGLIVAAVLVAVSIPIMIFIYTPVWTHPTVWNEDYHLDRYRWLGRELRLAGLRTGVLAVCGWWVAARAARTLESHGRARWAAILPLLVLADLLSAHWVDVPTVDPSYWTVAPETARRLKANPNTIRILGVCDKASGEPGYASEKLDFMPARDPLAWSLAPVWHVSSSNGLTPMISQRLVDFGVQAPARIRFDLEGDTHLLAGPRPNPGFAGLPNLHVGSAYVYRNTAALPRARLMGKPVYANDQRSANAALNRLGEALRDQVVVEDPERPLPTGAVVAGKARISDEIPERVVVETTARVPSYLVLSDTFDPGWSATVDGRPAPIRPAYVAFRAVFLPAGDHTVVFQYRPAGFEAGLSLTVCGLFLGLMLWFWPAGHLRLAPTHVALNWPAKWRLWWFGSLALIVVVSVFVKPPSAVADGAAARSQVAMRWRTGWHQHTWGAGIAAMKENRK